MNNKRGTTVVEIIISIALVSVVLIFLMNLFLTVREVYNKSKTESDYDMLNSIIIKAVGDDIDIYGLYDVEYEDDNKKDTVVLTFNSYRNSHMSERIKKVLRVTHDDEKNKDYISYSYESKYIEDEGSVHAITSEERKTNVVRSLPLGASLEAETKITLSKDMLNSNENIVKISIPLDEIGGNRYDINIFGIEKKSA